MKRLEELGISPTPWKVVPYGISTEGNQPTLGDVVDATGESLVVDLPIYKDACVLAAAPKLYDAAERYVRFHKESVVHGNRSAREILADAHKAFQDLQSALAEAAGESEVINV